MGWIERVYWVSAVGGASIFLLRMVLSLIGWGDGSADMGGDFPDGGLDAVDIHGGDLNFQLFSLQGLTGFFTMFGLVGLTLLKSGVTDLWTIAGALLAGLLTLFLISFIFFQASRLQSEGTLDLKNAVGMTGSVYLRIQENGAGQVQVPVQGSLRILDAVTENGESLPSGTSIRVAGIRDSQTVVVQKL